MSLFDSMFVTNRFAKTVCCFFCSSRSSTTNLKRFSLLQIIFHSFTLHLIRVCFSIRSYISFMKQLVSFVVHHPRGEQQIFIILNVNISVYVLALQPLYGVSFFPSSKTHLVYLGILNRYVWQVPRFIINWAFINKTNTRRERAAQCIVGELFARKCDN